MPLRIAADDDEQCILKSHLGRTRKGFKTGMENGKFFVGGHMDLVPSPDILLCLIGPIMGL